MSETKTTQLVLFDGTNYKSWRSRMILKLSIKGLYDVVMTEDTKDFQKDMEARIMLLDNVKSSKDHLIRDELSAYDMWKKLDAMFNKVSMSSAMDVYSDFAQAKLGPDESIENLGERIESNYRKLKELDYTLEDFKVLALLQAVPASYEAAVTTVVQKDKSEWNFDSILVVLKEAQHRIQKYGKSEETEMAMATQRRSNCVHCKRTNHSSAKCWFNPNNKQKQSANISKNHEGHADYQFSLIAQNALKATASSPNQVWYIDSGASMHFTPHKHFFTSYQSIAPFLINVANGSQIEVVGKGHIVVNVMFEGKERKIQIKDVHYAPKIQFNLLSVRQFELNKASITFADNMCTISQNNKAVIKSAAVNNNYAITDLNKYKQTNDVMAAYSSKASSLYDWHLRLGHASADTIKKAVNSGLIKGVKLADQEMPTQCKACISGKQHRQPITGTMDRATGLLQIVHSDVCGPMKTPTAEGYRYFVSMIDDYSKMSAVTLIKQKSDVPQAISDFINMAQNQLSKRVKEFHSDNGGEYINDRLQAAFKNHGIVHTKSSPNTPQQNSVAERFNRVILEMATCLMRERNVEERFWGYAVLYANRIRNRLPTKGTNNQVPYSLWSNGTPNLKHFHTFGCKALTLVDKSKRSKFGSHSVECTYLGPDSDHGVHILFNPETGKVFRSRNVEFIEGESVGIDESDNETVYVREEVQVADNTDRVQDQEIKSEPQESDPQTSPNEATTDDDDDLPHEHASDYTNNSDDHCRNFTDELNYNQNTIYGTPQKHMPNNAPNVHQQYQYQSKFYGSPESRSLYQTCNLDTIEEDELNANFSCANDNQRVIMGNAFASISGPASYKQAMKQDDCHQWQLAVAEELKSMEKNRVWDVVDKPNNRNIVTSRWVFVKKTDEHGNLERYKARLVARGFQQIPGQDFNETFAPVVRFTSIRAVIAIAAKHNMLIHQMDVKTAFLNGYLDEDIYMAIPDGVKVKDVDSKCLKLKKSIYGLKQSPLSWNKVLDDFLVRNQMTRSTADPGVYMRSVNNHRLFVTTYVDDLLIASQSLTLINEFKKKLAERFEMSDLGELKYILGIQVSQKSGRITISQQHYVDELLEKFKMPECKGYTTPMEPGAALVKATESDTIVDAPYASLIGSLLYLSNCTRPDITFAVNRLSAFNAQPTTQHWQAAKRVLRYLQETKDKGLVYTRNSDNTLAGYSDSDWASDKGDRRSTTGYFFMLNGNAISWNSKRQKTVAASSCEAEYMALFEAVKEFTWLSKLLEDLGEPLEKFVVHCDNKSAIELAKNPVHHQRSKHIDIKYHFIRERVQAGAFELQYLQSNEMIADALTKPLHFPAFSKLTKSMKLE
jgi:hypothetical protein